MIRQPANPRARQQPQQEASPQEPEETEEILGSDDEEQEDPNDYCKGESHLTSWFWNALWNPRSLSRPLIIRRNYQTEKSLIH